MNGATDMTAMTHDDLSAARAAKAQGQPVVGFLSNNVPVELIHAAGAFAWRLPTPPLRDTPLADRYLEQTFDPFARVALERLLRGEFALLDLLVLPRSVDSYQRLYYYLCELRRSFGAVLPEVHLYDVLHTPWQTSANYNYQRTVELARRLAAVSGNALHDGEISNAIALCNRLRVKLGALQERRQQTPCALTGEQMLALLGASQRTPPQDFERQLDAALARTPALAPGKRTLLIGSAHETPALHAAIARAGGQVVADYHVLGRFCWGPCIDEQQSPLAAISSHYHRDSVSVRNFPNVGALVACAQCVRAEAVVFFYYAQEEALTWELPAQHRALGALGLPILVLGQQTYPIQESVEAALRGFFVASSR
jgi:benzoyl-CoA reductase/2-hydroxyglutaryl-CoA dehydratase subunit BcrC/BadD/HgdB